MRKLLLAVIAMVVIGMTSCKKEDGAQPETNTSTVLDKKDTSGWD